MTTEHQEKTFISFYEVAEYLNIFEFQSFFFHVLTVRS